MLVLSRRIGEEIQIGPYLSLRALAISRGRVKLGISGPRAIPVARAELPPRTPVNDQRPRARSAQLAGGATYLRGPSDREFVAE
jgi:carbon storage regulator CsrA